MAIRAVELFEEHQGTNRQGGEDLRTDDDRRQMRPRWSPPCGTTMRRQVTLRGSSRESEFCPCNLRSSVVVGCHFLS